MGAIVLCACWISAALSDLRTMTIPNTISIVMTIGFVLFAAALGISIETIAYCLLAALITFVVCFGLFAINVMGGGDAKLLTASALWFGFSFPLVVFLVHTAFLGGLLTILILILRVQAKQFHLLHAFLPSSITNGHKVPYGIAISAAGLINLGHTTITQL
jgi:prepilin peptidase CpaA